MSASLGAFQASFFEAILAEPDARPEAAFARQPGFAVYRNTVVAGCIEALEANHPTTRAVVGEATFRELARAFVRRSPPSNGVLASYGAGFSTWLADESGAGLSPLVADLARLDRAWTESHLAADAPMLDPGALVALGVDRFAAARLVPHPAARWLVAGEAFTIWRAHREGVLRDGRDPGDGDETRVMAALLTRPDDVVVWTPIDRVAAAFLDACAGGRTVAEALDAAVGDADGSDVGHWLPGLMHARVFTRIDGVDADAGEVA